VGEVFHLVHGQDHRLVRRSGLDLVAEGEGLQDLVLDAPPAPRIESTARPVRNGARAGRVSKTASMVSESRPCGARRSTGRGCCPRRNCTLAGTHYRFTPDSDDDTQFRRDGAKVAPFSMDGKGKFTVHWQAERDDRNQPTPRSDTPPRSWETSLALLRLTSSYRT
jgi:hypothetical protein